MVLAFKVLCALQGSFVSYGVYSMKIYGAASPFLFRAVLGFTYLPLRTLDVDMEGMTNA